MVEIIPMVEYDSIYKNGGQKAEDIFSFTYTGKGKKADNIPATVSGDVLDIQVKWYRATVCHGTDIELHLKADKAVRYAYVAKDYTVAYLMDKDTWCEFCKLFATVQRESPENGSGLKMRLNGKTRAQYWWLSHRG